MPQEVEILQAKLDSLLSIAKSNEQKYVNFQEYELQLLNSTDLKELLSIILEQHKERFQLSNVTLLLIDPEYEIQRLFDNVARPRSWENHLLFTDSEHLIGRYFSVLRKPRLSPYSHSLHHSLFPKASNLQSVAIMPLIRQNKLIGSLNLGSRNPQRFQASIGTQFLQHLAAVMGACIENARLQETIKQTGLLDPLTGINNRRFFDQRVEEEVTLAKRNQTPLSCLFIDLDHFKRINDNYGHQAGDIVLKQSATIFSDIMRTTDVLARYGGEEFVILLANTTQTLAFEIAERIRHSIEHHLFKINQDKVLNITLSIGLATMIENTSIKTTQQLIKSADQAVYAAKVSGRNRVYHAN
jgi:two-component system cell cycle response regulator